MELGTEDIFLEQNRRPGGAGIVQRFGNEAPAGTAGRELMAHGMSALSALANRRVIVKVRTTNDTAAESGTGLLSRKSVQGSSFRLSGGGAIMSKAVSSLVQETLDHKLTLDHLQRIAPCFFAPSRSSSSSAPVAQAQRVSPREVNDTIMASGGTGSEELPAIGKALNVLHQQTENDLWLRGPPPPVTSLVAPRIQNAYSHVRNITQTRRALRGGDVEAGSFFSPTPPTMTNIPVGGGVAPAGADSSDDEHTESGSLSVSSTAQQKLSKEQRTSQMLHDVFNAQPLQLDEMAFTKAILDVMPYTSASAAQQLFRMVDVESNGFIDWEAFVTFLVSQTGEATANPAVTQSKELMPISVPRSCPSWLQHERSVSCMTVSPRTGTVYTGGMDGSVRSWDGVSLRHLKLWYTCPSWIVDIVLTFREQRLIICTTDRQLVVFDAKTGDVLRMYRGRRILETENGINFAHDSIPTVTLGGKIVSHAAPKNVKVRRLRNPASLMGGGHARGDGPPPPPNSDGDGPVGSPTSGGSSSPPPPAGSVSLEQFRAQMEEERSNQLERRRLEEYILAGLVDAPSCMEYHYSANDEDVVFFGMSDGSVRLYILPSGQQRLLRLHHTLRCHTARVRMMRVVPAMQAILTCSDDKTIKLTNLESGVVLKHYDKDGHDSGVNSFSYSATMKMFISCGSERCGIVWDQLQESAVARLDEHPCPVLCCFINDVERQFVSVGCDNSVFIFDARTYRLMQQFHERVRSNEQHLTKGSGGAGAASSSSTGGTAPGGGGAGSGNAATRGPGSGVGSYTMGWFDVPRQRLILATTYPVMHQMRRNVATLPAHYCGHTAPVVSLQFNAVFDLALTIDAEHLVLGWNISSGEATGLSFRLNSFASPHEDLRLTSCAFDVQQRRLITGFQTGTVVVWNVFNGSALCVIQAAPSSSPLSSEGVAVNTEVGVEASADKGSSSEVVAVASLQRDGQSLYVFSVGPYLITLKETPQFTVTNVPRWRVPSAVGVVTCMRPCSVVLVACGTSLGALMFFNLMSETSDGHVLFAEDTSDSSSTPTHLLSPMTQRSYTREAARASPQGVPSASPPPRALSPLGDGAAPSHLSRTIAVYPMTRLDHILLAVHADGRVFVWHTRRRLQVATFQLIPKGTGSSIVFTAMDSEEQYLAYTDDAGNVAVFSLPVAAASGNSPRSHIKLDEDAQELSFTATLQPVFSGGLWIATEDTITNNSMTSAATATSASESFPRLKQVSFFYGFTTSQTSLTLLRQRDKTLVVTTSTDFFTRVFDTEGHFLGELGMGRWRVSDRSTYKYKDRVSSPVLSNLEIPSEFTASGMGGPLMPSAGDIVVTSPVRVNGEPLIEINTPTSPRMLQPPPAAVYALPAAIAQQGTITAHLPRTLSPCSSLETPMGEQSAAAVVQQNRFNRRDTTTPEAQSSRPVSRAVVPPHLPQLGNPQPRIRTQRAGLVKPAIDRAALVGQDSRLSFSSDQNNDVGGGGGLPHSPGREPPPLNSMLLGGFSASLNPARGPSGAPITPNSARHPTAAPGGRSLKHVAAAALMAHGPGRSVRSDSISISTPGNLGDLPAGTLSSSHSEQAQRTRILSNHLDHQLSKLRACKSDLNDELKRVEARLARSNAQSTSSASAHGDMHASWTSRVAARLQLHELDDIQPPAGSKSSGDAGRRTHHRVRLGGTGGAGGALSSSRGGNNNQRAVEFFPSVTAPGTLVVGAKDEGAVDSNESSK